MHAGQVACDPLTMNSATPPVEWTAGQVACDPIGGLHPSACRAANSVPKNKHTVPPHTVAAREAWLLEREEHRTPTQRGC
jgi:hypothetical protein